MGVREVEIAGRTLTIHEMDDISDSTTGRALTGSWLWDSALHLSEWLATRHLDLTGKTVLELGAGTGLPGLTAAVLGATRVVLTDVAAILPCLKKNVEANGMQDRVQVRELVWGVEERLEAVGDVDVVVMSDVFFDPEEMEGLARTLRGVSGEGTRVWAASEVRASTSECLEVLEREGFEVAELPATTRGRQLRNPEESSLFAVYLLSRTGSSNLPTRMDGDGKDT